jgi:AcrR family transcriptional regulator
MEQFWIKGYEGASISDLTTAMGIGGPSLYAAFGSKEGLFREAATLYDATEGSQNWRALETASTAREATEGVLMDSAIAFGRKDKPAGCLNVLTAINATGANQAIHHEVRYKRRLCVDTLEARLRRAVEVGELSCEVDIRSVATFYVTVQQGMSIQARDGASAETLMRIARAAMSAWEALTQPADRSGNGSQPESIRSYHKQETRPGGKVKPKRVDSGDASLANAGRCRPTPQLPRTSSAALSSKRS